jgi:hypothetical protein
LRTQAPLDIIGLNMMIAFLAAAVFAGQPPDSITSVAVGRMIDRRGAKRTVEKLTNIRPGGSRSDFGAFDQVLDGIASGDARWLALVSRLAPGTDAGTAESLRIVVAEALPRNPAAVLGLIEKDPSWRDACGYPMIEPTRQEARAYFKAAIPAVKSVHDPALQAARRVCLSELLKAQHTR